ncbi:MAG: hypothetical protein IPH45_21080, partial [Bacteroidales bacterium]|nr:hypothetical protein [Bacteroidales bacterium]
FPLIPGLHELKWEYNKDKAVENGLDAAFVDYIEFPSIQYTTSDAGPDASINECQNFACLGAASYYDSLRWTTTGSGIFLSILRRHIPNIPPSQADKAAGWVTLILTVFGPSVNEIAIDSMNLVIVPRPTAYAGPDAGICAGEAFHVALASAANYQSLSWSTLGQGVFNDRASVLPVYSPGAADSIAGKVHLVLSTYSNNTEGCGMAKDTLELTIYSLPVIPLEEKV